IDLLKPSEVYENYFKNEKVFYGGFYHIVGNYLSGDDVWQPVTKDLSHQKATEMFHVANDFDIGFTHIVAVVPEGFPQPVLQMEVSFTLPWVLDESYNDKQPTKKELREINKKAYKQQFIEKLKEIIDISKIDTDADCWDIDKINHMGVEILDSGSIVYFSDEHQHFWEHNNDDYDFVVETVSFIKDLLAGQTRFERSYRGKKLIRVAYYTKADGTDEWILQQNFGTALFRPLFRFPKKVVKTEIIEFRQQ
ncbi:MAG: hypothetical protein FWH42_02705, partial [Dehalococcoidia bacterium]|nr:hypothetical protein [Dehalococcoidia bacterium]